MSEENKRLLSFERCKNCGVASLSLYKPSSLCTYCYIQKLQQEIEQLKKENEENTNALINQIKLRDVEIESLRSKLLTFEGMKFFENVEIKLLKKENLLLSDDRELYMRHRDILIDALKKYKGFGYAGTYCADEALKEVGEI